MPEVNFHIFQTFEQLHTVRPLLVCCHDAIIEFWSCIFQSLFFFGPPRSGPTFQCITQLSLKMKIMCDFPKTHEPIQSTLNVLVLLADTTQFVKLFYYIHHPVSKAKLS